MPMRRKTFWHVVILALVILTAPLIAEAQQDGKVPRMGFLRAGPLPQDFLQGFQQGLRDHGYREGQNIIIEYRLTDGNTGALANLVARLGHPAHPTYAAQKEAAEAGARSLGVQLASIDVHDPKDFEAAFKAAHREQALIQMDGIFFTTHRALLTELAVSHGLPAIY